MVTELDREDGDVFVVQETVTGSDLLPADRLPHAELTESQPPSSQAVQLPLQPYGLPVMSTTSDPDEESGFDGSDVGETSKPVHEQPFP